MQCGDHGDRSTTSRARHLLKQPVGLALGGAARCFNRILEPTFHGGAKSGPRWSHGLRRSHTGMWQWRNQAKPRWQPVPARALADPLLLRPANVMAGDPDKSSRHRAIGRCGPRPSAAETLNLLTRMVWAHQVWRPTHCNNSQHRRKRRWPVRATSSANCPSEPLSQRAGRLGLSGSTRNPARPSSLRYDPTRVALA